MLWQGIIDLTAIELCVAKLSNLMHEKSDVCEILILAKIAPTKSVNIVTFSAQVWTQWLSFHSVFGST